MTTQGKVVCKKTTREMAEKVMGVYAAKGHSPEMFAHADGTFQVVVRGRKLVKTSVHGTTNSFGGGVPLLKKLAPELAAEIATA